MLMISLSAIVYYNLSKFEKDRKWVTHTYQAIESIQKCGASLINMETGVRGFLVAGNDEFLEPYEEGEKTFKEIWEY
jgi:methyl-accepting chemotaxis protein